MEYARSRAAYGTELSLSAQFLRMFFQTELQKRIDTAQRQKLRLCEMGQKCLASR